MNDFNNGGNNNYINTNIPPVEPNNGNNKNKVIAIINMVSKYILIVFGICVVIFVIYFFVEINRKSDVDIDLENDDVNVIDKPREFKFYYYASSDGEDNFEFSKKDTSTSTLIDEIEYKCEGDCFYAIAIYPAKNGNFFATVDELLIMDNDELYKYDKFARQLKKIPIINKYETKRFNMVTFDNGIFVYDEYTASASDDGLNMTMYSYDENHKPNTYVVCATSSSLYHNIYLVIDDDTHKAEVYKDNKLLATYQANNNDLILDFNKVGSKTVIETYDKRIYIDDEGKITEVNNN